MKRRVFLLFAAALLLNGCGRPTVNTVTPETVVVAFGDSLTEGYGTEAAASYPAMLAKLLGCKVVNAGVSGEVSGEGARRLPNVLSRYKPDLVVICHGGNDFLNGGSDAAVEQNVRTMVSAVQASGADAVVLGVPRPGLLLRAPPFYAAVAKEHRLPCDVTIVPRVLSSASLKSDLIHPNEEGYRQIAQRVADLIRASER